MVREIVHQPVAACWGRCSGTAPHGQKALNHANFRPGERLNRTQEVAGSSPASSITYVPRTRAVLGREDSRAAAGGSRPSRRPFQGAVAGLGPEMTTGGLPRCDRLGRVRLRRLDGPPDTSKLLLALTRTSVAAPIAHSTLSP